MIHDYFKAMSNTFYDFTSTKSKTVPPTIVYLIQSHQRGNSDLDACTERVFDTRAMADAMVTTLELNNPDLEYWVESFYVQSNMPK